MDDGCSEIRRWEDLDTDVLVKIFQMFDIFELTERVARVCSAWRTACRDPILWKTLDFSRIKSNFIKIPLEPYVYVACHSDEILIRLIKVSLSLSRGSIMTMIFHFHLFISDDQLSYAAERTPQLKRLVLPAWNRIKKTGMCKAICSWRDLESLTMPSIENSPYFLKEISLNCKNFRELKVLGPCEMSLASSLVEYLPHLKVLILRCSMLSKDTVILILDGLKHLEVLNIAHCLLIEILPPPEPERIIREIDQSIRKKASRLREFHTCLEDSCIMCCRTKNDEGLLRWYRYEEREWLADEVKSLHL